MEPFLTALADHKRVNNRMFTIKIAAQTGEILTGKSSPLLV
jgi:hypothetical protein